MDEVTLPELPQPALETNGDVFGHENVEGYTADQMRNYARAAVLSYRIALLEMAESKGWGMKNDDPWEDSIAAIMQEMDAAPASSASTPT